MANWTEQKAHIAEAELTLIKGGTGKPLLMLHDELGFPGWVKWNDEMAADRAFVIPLQPGFGKTPRLEWIRNFRDSGRPVQHGGQRNGGSTRWT